MNIVEYGIHHTPLIFIILFLRFILTIVLTK